jgi:hypothetical protein
MNCIRCQVGGAEVPLWSTASQYYLCQKCADERKNIIDKIDKLEKYIGLLVGTVTNYKLIVTMRKSKQHDEALLEDLKKFSKEPAVLELRCWYELYAEPDWVEYEEKRNGVFESGWLAKAMRK